MDCNSNGLVVRQINGQKWDNNSFMNFTRFFDDITPDGIKGEFKDSYNTSFDREKFIRYFEEKVLNKEEMISFYGKGVGLYLKIEGDELYISFSFSDKTEATKILHIIEKEIKKSNYYEIV